MKIHQLIALSIKTFLLLNSEVVFIWRITDRITEQDTLALIFQSTEKTWKNIPKVLIALIQFKSMFKF